MYSRRDRRRPGQFAVPACRNWVFEVWIPVRLGSSRGGGGGARGIYRFLLAGTGYLRSGSPTGWPRHAGGLRDRAARLICGRRLASLDRYYNAGLGDGQSAQPELCLKRFLIVLASLRGINGHSLRCYIHILISEYRDILQSVVLLDSGGDLPNVHTANLDHWRGIGRAGSRSATGSRVGLAAVSWTGPERHLQGNRPLTQMAGSRTEAPLVGPRGRGLCRRRDRGRPGLSPRLRRGQVRVVDQLPLARRRQADLAVPRAARNSSESRHNPHYTCGRRPVRLLPGPQSRAPLRGRQDRQTNLA